MSRILLLLLAVLVALPAASCARGGPQGPPPDVTLNLAVTPDPPSVGPATLTLTLKDKTGATIDGAIVSIKGDMTHPGMTPVLAAIRQSSGGVYNTLFEWTRWVPSISSPPPSRPCKSRRETSTCAGRVWERSV